MSGGLGERVQLRIGTEKRRRAYQAPKLRRRGIEQILTIDLGVAAAQMERKGINSERGEINPEIEFANKQIRQSSAWINKLKERLIWRMLLSEKVRL
jgi:hypothetical protein